MSFSEKHSWVPSEIGDLKGLMCKNCKQLIVRNMYVAGVSWLKIFENKRIDVSNLLECKEQQKINTMDDALE